MEFFFLGGGEGGGVGGGMNSSVTTFACISGHQCIESSKLLPGLEKKCCLKQLNGFVQEGRK